MQKTALTKAALLALASLGASAALAQSSVTIYGNVDVGFDSINREKGNGASALNVELKTNRVTTDLSSQSALGFRGVEDLGGGYKAGFVMEGQVGNDTGALSRDGRLFGRQMYAGITTPYGEVRLGRQYNPIFFSSALVTSERFGATDLYLEGGLSNTLHIRWDNAITYSAEMSGFRFQAGYSPQAGVAAKINANRGAAGSDANGSILGGNNAGASTENNDDRGASYGLFGAYTGFPGLTMTAGYSNTNFEGATLCLATACAPTTTLGNLDTYKVWNLGAKYDLTALGIAGLQINTAFGRGTYDFQSVTPVAGALGVEASQKISHLVIGTRYNMGAWGFLGQFSESKFRNGSRGKNQGFMLGAEYSLSKRTTLYSRYGQIDDSGSGPDVVLPSTGIREVPVLAGAGISPDGKTSLLGVGVRHNF